MQISNYDSTFNPIFDQEVDHESRYFDTLRELAESNYADPGEEFTTTATLIPVTDYYGDAKTIAVQVDFMTVGTLPVEDVDEWWRLAVAANHASDDLEVDARIWTCRDWETKFYASVRIALPGISEGEDQADDAFDESDFAAVAGFKNPLEEYWDPKWRKAHGMTDEEYKARADEAHRRAEEYLAERDQPQPTPSVVVTNPYASPAPASWPFASTVGVDWVRLLTPDASGRANLFQRGYARGVAGKALGNIKAPRIDYATVQQCRNIVATFGGDVAEIDKRGSSLLKALWWVLLIVLGIWALIGIVTAPVGLILTALVVWPFAYHYWTRRKLVDPFGPQGVL
jgi:hypothetical protein